MLDIEKVREGTVIQYQGSSVAYGGDYTVCSMESTYVDPQTCPATDRGKLVIIEFTNNDNPMFFEITTLNPKEWIIKQ